MSEMSAKGKKGFILYNPFDHKFFFRIYDKEDKRKFVDYKICCEEVEVEILDNFTTLYEEEGKEPRLGWSRKVLGK